MKIVIDSHIPYIKGVLEEIAEVKYLSGKSIDANAVKEADALFIRTRTKCNASLLNGSRVKFIASATIGMDHIDTDYCAENGIFCTNAPGCNSSSVAQYILSSLLLYEEKRNVSLKGKVMGVIGVGNVGKKVAFIASLLGMNVLLNDPPRAEKEGENGFVDLTTIMEEADVITFHTPLLRDGKYKTEHLADKSFFSNLKKKPLLINASRGEVVDTDALCYAHQKHIVSDMIIDCWENEPYPNTYILYSAFLTTPHIAGYSADGKGNATRMSLESFYRFYDMEVDKAKDQVIVPKPSQTECDYISFKQSVLFAYNPILDSMALKDHPDRFEFFRENYPLRREFAAYMLNNVPDNEKEKIQKIGFRLKPENEKRG